MQTLVITRNGFRFTWKKGSEYMSVTANGRTLKQFWWMSTAQHRQWELSRAIDRLEADHGGREAAARVLHHQLGQYGVAA